MSNDSTPEFDEFESGRFKLILHRGLASHATTLVRTIQALRASNQPGAGGRASVHRVKLGDSVEVMVRRSLRGGMMRHLDSDLFVGLEARRRNIRVAEPVGAVVEWLAPLLYRGWFVTRPLCGMTLWEFMQTGDDPAVREHVLMAARDSIKDLEDGGLLHPDLNLHNLFVTKSGEQFVVVILDLDKARFLDWPLPEGIRRQQADRLARSARKLDPAGQFFDAKASAILEIR